MDSSLEKRATLKHKIYACIAFGIACLLPIGASSELLISDEKARLLTFTSIALSIVLLTILFISLPRRKSTIREIIEDQKKSPLLMGIALTMGIPITIYLSIARGLPATLHFFISTHGSMDVTVSGKSSRYREKHCKGRILLSEYNSLMSNQICGVTKKSWEDLKPGDKLRLYGRRSFFGFNHINYTKLTDTEISI
ncbi:hypothetical protein [Microbulbifer sp. TRSA005]|uniref:hypothetical protein n=1 Tax=Microbulbifer sp. TRSA005 TaxID=3243383 RepID=UPI00403A3262